MRVISSQEPNFKKELQKWQNHRLNNHAEIENQVKKILDKVRRQGDKALLEYTARFDGVKLSPENILVSKAEIQAAEKKVRQEEKQSLILAKKRIERFHQHQLPRTWTIHHKEREILGQKVIPLNRVGIYVPGGKAFYPSSVLMNALPARIAGVKEIFMVTPPRSEGIDSAILVTAQLCGIDKIFKVGGAQAIAALAYGTKTIPRVDKIVGPGNIFVAKAKKLVSGEVGIDMIAGPSEILIIADKTARPEYIAADLLSQAEHDEEAKAILITTSKTLATKVKKEIEIQIAQLSRKKILLSALTKNGIVIITDNLYQAVELANDLAPEHLMLTVKSPFRILEKIKNAGSVFLGNFSPVAAGDYLVGPNHVLPTAGTARFSSPLGVYDFVKFFSFTYLSQKQIKKLGKDIIRLARL
ncbi:MAG: histidinol dehydrogenase, partial [Desulfobacterota bacterium]|nr:histidinol dehydrogenase [Thermodesulfobacteriota bacterium]